MHPLKAK